MRALVVEDDDRIADFLIRALRSEGISSVRSGDGAEALALASNSDFDIILLDLMLPSMNGLDVCQALRMRDVQTAVIMLTAMDTVDDVIRGLRMGADDYLTKPFVIDELLARMDAVLRRGNEQPTDPVLRFEDVEFDRHLMQASVHGECIVLSAKELALLELFLANPGRVFSQERILNNVWGLDKDPLTNVVAVYIGKLRRKFDAHNASASIETVRGIGYRLVRK